MTPKLYYAPVSEAITALRKDGFKEDFTLLEDGRIGVKDIPHEVADFAVDCIYRYEGSTDPGDEAIVYGLHNGAGVKGVLVGGYGHSSDIRFDNATGQLHS